MLSTLFPLLVALQLSESPAPEMTQRFDLATVLRRAASHASVLAAQSAAEQAHAKTREVERMWIPRFDASAVGGPSPVIRCYPSKEQCWSTVPTQLELGFNGIFWRIDAHMDMPLFTFGKLSAGIDAATAGGRAAEALATQTQHGVVADAAKAYFAVKLGRELINMLNEGRGHVQDEIARQEKLLDEGSGDVTEADHRRLLSLIAEIDARRSEARRVEEMGLAGVHYAVGRMDVDVDEEPLLRLEYELAPTPTELLGKAADRPERQAAEAGFQAMERLSALERRRWWPDFVLLGQGSIAEASAVEHPSNAFLNDPFNFHAAGLMLGLRWAPEASLRMAKIDQADADMLKAQSQLDLARQGLPADIERAWAELHDAQGRLAAAKQGERHAKAWLASVLQAEAAGLVEARDLADATFQFFMMRARTIQGTFDWNVGVMGLQRATGQLPQAGPFAEE